MSEDISFEQIMFYVLPECFLWGLGTALGELPPYFISYAAGIIFTVAKNKKSSLAVPESDF